MTQEITLEPGQQMDDGTIYAGSLDGRDIYAAPADATLTSTFKEATAYVARLNRENYLGHNDWRVPTGKELDVLYHYRNEGALKNTFNATGLYPSGWYWSSTEHLNYAWGLRFSDGRHDWNDERYDSSLRCVR